MFSHFFYLLCTQSEGDNTDKENSSQTRNSQQQTRKRRNNREYCIKVSNIDRNSRLKDLKAELRKRGCNPMFISWKGTVKRVTLPCGLLIKSNQSFFFIFFFFYVYRVWKMLFAFRQTIRTGSGYGRNDRQFVQSFAFRTKG